MPLPDATLTRLESVLDTLDRFLPFGGSFIPVDWREPVRFGRCVPAFCRECLSRSCPTLCRQAVVGGGQQAWVTAEPYFFPCPMGLNTCVLPVVRHGRLVGVVEFGGFHFAESGDEAAAHVHDNAARLEGSSRRLLHSLQGSIAMVPAREAEGHGMFVMDALLSHGVNRAEEFQNRRERYLQQRRIGERMHRPGNADRDTSSLVPALGMAVGAGNETQLMRLLDEFFSRALLAVGSDVARLKAHVLPLPAAAARQRVLGGSLSVERGIAIQVRALEELQSQQEIEDVCYWAFRFMRECVRDELAVVSAEHGLCKRVLDYVGAHAIESPTLEDAAAAVGASVSTIAKRLRRELSTTFHAQVLARKLAEAKHQLVHTAMPVKQIATQCGFHDTSHLGKCLRRDCNLSPSAYRRSAGL